MGEEGKGRGGKGKMEGREQRIGPPGKIYQIQQPALDGDINWGGEFGTFYA